LCGSLFLRLYCPLPSHGIVLSPVTLRRILVEQKQLRKLVNSLTLSSVSAFPVIAAFQVSSKNPEESVRGSVAEASRDGGYSAKGRDEGETEGDGGRMRPEREQERCVRVGADF
jgi:hypothetical protein